jgi:hypothetical protein
MTESNNDPSDGQHSPDGSNILLLSARVCYKHVARIKVALSGDLAFGWLI